MRVFSQVALVFVTAALSIYGKKVTVRKVKRHPNPVPDIKNSTNLLKSIDTKSNSSIANSDSLTSVDAIYYVGPVDIGSQTFQVIYDTGSNLLWVPSSSCGSDCVPHQEYTGEKQTLNQPFTIQYGSGKASGEYAMAPVTLADASLSSFKIGLADDVDFEGYSQSQYDGLLGLAWPGLSGTSNVPSLVPSLYEAGQIPANLFAIYLTHDGTGGELSLGEIDETRYQGNLTWLPLTLDAWWTVGMTGLTVGQSSTQVVSTSWQSAETTIVDSGTSMIVGPNDQVMILMEAVQSEGNVPVYYSQSSELFYVACSDVSKLPDITFTLQGSDNQQYLYTMPGESYVIQSLSSNPSVCPLSFQQSGASTGGTVDWILGDPFLRVFYSVYDYENRRVGLAAAYPSAGTVIPGSKSVGVLKSWSAPVVVVASMCLVVM
jgi:hypothetical protein